MHARHEKVAYRTKLVLGRVVGGDRMKLQLHRTLPLHIQYPPQYSFLTANDFTCRMKLQIRRTSPLHIENPPQYLT